MESWSYISGGKGFVNDDTVSGTGGIQGISKTGLTSSELKSPWSYEFNGRSSNLEGEQIQEFVDLGSSYMMRKSLPKDSIGDGLAGKFSDGKVISSVSVPLNAFSCEDDSSSMFSSSAVESNPSDSSLIDLKLGRLGDQGNVKTYSASAVKTNLSFSEASILVKRARARSLGSQTPYCQVHGCRKDLSSCKDYHKRHKVCEIHSKTTMVIVNGIEQRFCQQCSRFHLLPEFDDGKRSCRKRLAGHNERRRKPHNHIHAVRARRLFQSFNTNRPEGNSLSASSFVCQDILPTCHLRDHNVSSRFIKVEDGTNLRSQFTITDDEHQKSLFTQHTSEKQRHSLEDDGLSVMTKRGINENNSYFQDIGDSTFFSRIAFPSFPLGNEDMSVLESSSTIGGFSDVANSGHALSLLSSQSQCSSISTSGLATILPLASSGSRVLYPLPEPPENLLGVSSQAPTSGTSSTFSSFLLSSPEKNHVSNMLISNDGAGAAGTDRILQHSAYMSSKNHFPFQQGSTIDLLRLSTQLQRVEHQRKSSMLKDDKNDF